MKIIESFDKLLKSDDIVGELRKITQEKSNNAYNKLRTDIIDECYEAALEGRDSVYIGSLLIGSTGKKLTESALRSMLGPMGFKIEFLAVGFTVSWEKRL